MSATTLERPTVKYSELSRNSKAVAAAADRGPVEIDRRDAEPLILMLESTFNEHYAGVELAARVLGVVGRANGKPTWQDLAVQFPWIELLPGDQRSNCLSDILTTTQGCAALTNFQPLVVTVESWKATAEAYAMGWDALATEWLPASERAEVPRP